MQDWQEKIERRLRKLEEQRTEEMRAINVNVASQDVITRLDKLEQDLNAHSNAWLDAVQEHYEEHKDAISDVQTVQKGHSKFFEGHGKRLAATATKDDIARLESDITSIKTTQEKQGLLLQEILNRLTPKP